MNEKPATKPAAKKAAKKTAAKKKAKRPYRPGFMGRKEIQPLVIAAREAFDYQSALGNVEAGQSFDDWRRAEVRNAVQREGISDCLHEHFQPLMGHFKVLAGRDGEALESFLSSGPATAQPGDDYEGRRVLAYTIVLALEEHIHLADVGAQQLAEETEDTAVYQGLRRRRDAIRSHPQGALREGYLVHLTRQKTRRPNLTLGKDLKAGLAERCTVDQLTQIRDTLVNRIAAREGRADKGRNGKQKSAQARAERAPDQLAPRFEFGGPVEPDPF